MLGKPVFLLQIVEGAFKRQGYVLVSVETTDEGMPIESRTKGFHVAIKLNDSDTWTELPLNSVIDTKKISLFNFGENSNQCTNLTRIKGDDELFKINFNKGTYYLLNNISSMAEISDENLNTLPVPSYNPEAYEYQDLIDNLVTITSAHNISSKSDIFEHSLLRMAGIPVSFQAKNVFECSAKNPDHFFMSMELKKNKGDSLLAYLNNQYGSGTAEYSEFEEGCYGFYLNLATTINEILPDVAHDIEKIITLPNMREAYQKPFAELDKNLQEALQTLKAAAYPSLFWCDQNGIGADDDRNSVEFII